MSQWRRVAIEMMPQLKQDIEQAQTPEDLWDLLAQYTDIAYAEPKDEELLTKIFGYAHWCLQTPIDEPLFYAVTRDFYGLIVRDKVRRKDMPFRITKADFQTLRDEHWVWLLDDEVLERVEKEFWEAKDRWLRKRGGRDVY
jgi:hypothetical protein